ncbi:PRD domain-containing protein, partial [Bacillus pumilus]|uniref:PRD domain-containing protein n=1 Tax=Bacillus pumilus TaxID=1408 RepID=UPI0011A41F2D
LKPPHQPKPNILPNLILHTLHIQLFLQTIQINIKHPTKPTQKLFALLTTGHLLKLQTLLFHFKNKLSLSLSHTAYIPLLVHLTYPIQPIHLPETIRIEHQQLIQLNPTKQFQSSFPIPTPLQPIFNLHIPQPHLPYITIHLRTPNPT